MSLLPNPPKGRPLGGEKKGGRKPGQLNRRTDSLLKRLERQFPNYHPIMHMASVANDESNDVTVRFAASKEVARYVVPQLRTIEHKGLEQGATNIQIIITPHGDADHHG